MGGLFRAVQKNMHNVGIKTVLLTVDPMKKKIVRFYEKYGFTTKYKEKSCFGPGKDRMVMEAIL